MQAFVVAWDSRQKEQGGQRWFDLYPDQKIKPSDPLHWTGRNQTWNYMCADCHSTNLRKNYDLAKDSYATTWSEIDVSCESCHGPGSNHVAWAQTHKKGSYKASTGAMGLVVDLKLTDGMWAASDPDTGTMHWKGQARSHNEINTCAPCHSRRHAITSDAQPGQPYLDNYVPSLLEEGVYYADGQILEEDYEWGSFLQSKMYRNGVTCSDCHDPAQRQVTGGVPERGLRQVSLAGEVRHRAAPSSQGRQRWRAVRQLPHANAHLHGGGRASRSQLPRAASRFLRCLRNAERLQPVPQRQVERLGRRDGREVVRPKPQAGSAFRRSSGCRPPRIDQRGEIADSVDR